MNTKGSWRLVQLTMLLVLGVLMATGGALQAQRRGGGGRSGGGRSGGGRMDPAQMQKQIMERTESQYQKMCETLVLNEQQREQADELFKKAQQDKKNLFKKMSGDRSKMRSTFGKIRKTQYRFMEELEKLLTGEQQERFELIKKELEERRPRRNR